MQNPQVPMDEEKLDISAPGVSESWLRPAIFICITRAFLRLSITRVIQIESDLMGHSCLSHKQNGIPKVVFNLGFFDNIGAPKAAMRTPRTTIKEGGKKGAFTALFAWLLPPCFFYATLWPIKHGCTSVFTKAQDTHRHLRTDRFKLRALTPLRILRQTI